MYLFVGCITSLAWLQNESLFYISASLNSEVMEGGYVLFVRGGGGDVSRAVEDELLSLTTRFGLLF